MKKAALATVALFVMVLGLTGCWTRSTSSLQTTLAPAAAPGDYVVIGSFARRDQVVTVKTGPNGVVYTVAGKDGKIQFENLTAAELKEKTPQLHEYIETGTGGWAGF
jgi:hypothetical protein